LSTPFALAIKMRLENFDHDKEGFTADAAGSFEGSGSKQLELFVGHDTPIQSDLLLTQFLYSCKRSIESLSSFVRITGLAAFNLVEKL
jgi:hypothetical protein